MAFLARSKLRNSFTNALQQMLKRSLATDAAASVAIPPESSSPSVITSRLVDSQTQKPNGIVVLTLNQPAKLNPMSEELGLAFEQTIEDLIEDESIRVVVITGAGRAFSAGADLQFLSERSKASLETNQRLMSKLYMHFLCLQDLPIPVIAAINGPAVGGGFATALACDMRIAAAGTHLGLNFARLGITPGMGSSFTLAHVSNPQVASRLLLTGELITAEEALRLGLVLSVEPADKVLPKALELAEKIAIASPLSVRGTVKMLRETYHSAEFSLALQREVFNQAVCFTEPDLSLGLEAVRTKRPARFADFPGDLTRFKF